MSSVIVPVSTTKKPSAFAVGGTFDRILSDAEIGIGLAGEFGAAFGGPAVPAVASILARLIGLAQTALETHSAISGVPIDQLIAQMTHIEHV